jgi:hypothetical protein
MKHTSSSHVLFSIFLTFIIFFFSVDGHLKKLDKLHDYKFTTKLKSYAYLPVTNRTTVCQLHDPRLNRSFL